MLPVGPQVTISDSGSKAAGDSATPTFHAVGSFDITPDDDNPHLYEFAMAGEVNQVQPYTCQLLLSWSDTGEEINWQGADVNAIPSSGVSAKIGSWVPLPAPTNPIRLSTNINTAIPIHVLWKGTFAAQGRKPVVQYRQII